MRALARAKILKKNTREIRMHLRVIYVSLSACWNIRIALSLPPSPHGVFSPRRVPLPPQRDPKRSISPLIIIRPSYHRHCFLNRASIAASISHTSVLDPKQDLETGIGLQVLRQSALSEIQERQSLGTMAAVTKAMRISMFSS